MGRVLKPLLESAHRSPPWRSGSVIYSVFNDHLAILAKIFNYTIKYIKSQYFMTFFLAKKDRNSILKIDT